jgi:hypothetical protein
MSGPPFYVAKARSSRESHGDQELSRANKVHALLPLDFFAREKRISGVTSPVDSTGVRKPDLLVAFSQKADHGLPDFLQAGCAASLAQVLRSRVRTLTLPVSSQRLSLNPTWATKRLSSPKRRKWNQQPRPCQRRRRYLLCHLKIDGWHRILIGQAGTPGSAWGISHQRRGRIRSSASDLDRRTPL